MNARGDTARWVGIKAGKIATVGAGEAPVGKAEKSIDLAGAVVLPGLMDSHVHVMPTGHFLDGTSLLDAKNIGETLNLLKERRSKTPAGDWIFGVGFMSQKMEEGRFPNRLELDEVSQEHPIMVSAQTLHGIALNSAALALVNVPDVAGVGRFADGTLDGTLLSDDAAFPCMSGIMAGLPDERLRALIERCCAYAAEKGVTTMSGLVGQFVDGDKDVEIVLKHGERFPVNISVFYQTWDLEKVKRLRLPRIGGCLTLDGAGFEYTMALGEPYPQRPERRGFLIHTDEEVYDLVSAAHRENIQCALHALGDRAIDQLLYVFLQVIGEQGRKDLRHRVEHFSLPTNKHMDLAAELGLVLSMQPAFTGLWGQPEGGYYELLLGRERADRMEVFPEIVKRGGIVCGGSDSPVTLPDPLYGIACCVNNPDPRRNVSVTDAIKMFTWNAAYSMRLDTEKGSIETGKDADLTVIDRNPYDLADSPEIYNMKVLMTMKGGKITHE